MGDKIKIVMIDDEADLCLLVKSNLEDTGEYTVATSTNPETAESFIKQEAPNLLLLDNVMPKRKGGDIVKALKKDPELKRLPIIMVSGKGEMVFDKKKQEFKWMPNNPLTKDRGTLPDVKGAEALSQAYGVDDYVSKPFATELLIEVIKDVLQKKAKSKPEENPDSGVGAV